MARSTFVAVKLAVTHTIERDPSKLVEAVSIGWPKVVSNLKSVLETGSAALQDPYPNQHSQQEASRWLRWSLAIIRRFSFLAVIEHASAHSIATSSAARS
jgi:hypothetical protein